MAQVGRTMAERLNEAKGHAAVVIPLRGWSVYGAPGGPLHDALGDKAFLNALKSHLRVHVQLREIDAHINDEIFVDVCVKQLVTFMDEVRS